MVTLERKSRTLPVWVLAAGAFVVACTEFMTVGLVPTLAGELRVSASAIGQLVTLNAVAVAVAAPLLGAVFARWPIRRVLVLALAGYAAAHVLAAAAPTFAVLLSLRLITGAAFGLYLSAAFAAAARLAAPGTLARSLAIVQGGITTATALGVPLNMVLGQAAGWRLPFLVLGLLGVLAAVAVTMTVPSVPPTDEASLRQRLGVLGRRPVALAVTTIAVFWAGSLAAFTYLVPVLADHAGLGAAAITGVLFLAGAMSVAGNVLGGRGAERAPGATMRRTALIAFAALAALLVGGHVAVIAVVLVGIWQLASWSYVPAVQARTYELGGEAAVSFSVAAFNVGIVAGAGAGGIALSAGGGAAVIATAAVLAAAAYGLTVGLSKTGSG